MPEDIQKRLNVTFGTGLPLGTRATFTHDRQLWIAYPATKQAQIHACIDRLAGSLTRIKKQLIAWLSTQPDDAQRVALLLNILAHAEQIQNEILTEKTRAVTA